MALLEGEFPDDIGPGPGAFLLGSPLADLELAPLNPDLGRYFGATEGILIISVPKDSDLGLKGGDVVLAVDGRKPASPSHLLRIMRSYERGEGFKLDILRNGKRESVTGRAGAKAGG
jgi:S1-C subfamily serine protease